MAILNSLLAQQLDILAGQLLTQGRRITTAESCTGGGISAALTDIAGSSAWFEYGFVTYSNEAKTRLIDVPEQLLVEYGAVSQPVVEAMVAGALSVSGADIAIGVSGVAGPDGGTEDKPVGSVWLCWQLSGFPPVSKYYRFGGGRAAIRSAAVTEAVQGANELLLSTIEKPRDK